MAINALRTSLNFMSAKQLNTLFIIFLSSIEVLALSPNKRPLSSLIKRESEAAQKLLEQKYKNINEQDLEGNTPLHHAVLHEKINLIKKLLKVVQIF